MIYRLGGSGNHASPDKEWKHGESQFAESETDAQEQHSRELEGDQIASVSWVLFI